LLVAVSTMKRGEENEATQNSRGGTPGDYVGVCLRRFGHLRGRSPLGVDILRVSELWLCHNDFSKGVKQWVE
jgi:hypothetical protein